MSEKNRADSHSELLADCKQKLSEAVAELSKVKEAYQSEKTVVKSQAKFIEDVLKVLKSHTC